MKINYLERILYNEAIRDNNPDVSWERAEATAISYVGRWIVRQPRIEGLAFARESNFSQRIERLLPPDNKWMLEASVVSYVNIVELVDGPSKALDILLALPPWPKNLAPYYRLMCMARIAQLKGETWDEPSEFPKRHVVRYFKPYFSLLAAATNKHISDKHIHDVDKAFSVRQSKNLFDDELLGYETNRITWDHYKCAILNSAGVPEDEWGENT